MNSFKNALLASSVLTTVGFGASATTFVEDSTLPLIVDFSNTVGGANPINFSMYQSVQGTLHGTADPADYLTFTGLTLGDDFSVTFSRANDGPSSFGFTADGFSETLAPGSSKTDNGVLGGTSLTIGMTDPYMFTGFAEGYTVSLSETPAGVPEPSTAAIFSVGLAGLAVARRKRRR